MTPLQWIIKEAKAIRKKNPKMEWKKAVAQASAIYASKHKGKSPVGKKHAVKKKAAKKKAVGKVDPNKAFKKQMQVSKTINAKYKNWEYPVPPVYTGNWSVTTWSEWIKKHGRKIGSVKKISGSQDYYTRKKEGRIIKKKVVRKTATKKAKKKPTEKQVLKSIKHAVSVQEKHMSGVGASSFALYNNVSEHIDKAKKHIIMAENHIFRLKQYGNSPTAKKSIKMWKEYIKEQKTHITQLKKHI